MCVGLWAHLRRHSWNCILKFSSTEDQHSDRYYDTSVTVIQLKMLVCFIVLPEKTGRESSLQSYSKSAIHHWPYFNALLIALSKARWCRQHIYSLRLRSNSSRSRTCTGKNYGTVIKRTTVCFEQWSCVGHVYLSVSTLGCLPSSQLLVRFSPPLLFFVIKTCWQTHWRFLLLFNIQSLFFTKPPNQKVKKPWPPSSASSKIDIVVSRSISRNM